MCNCEGLWNKPQSICVVKYSAAIKIMIWINILILSWLKMCMMRKVWTNLYQALNRDFFFFFFFFCLTDVIMGDLIFFFMIN
jgi:hypothetical protein